jgi:hypothetical protein
MMSVGMFILRAPIGVPNVLVLFGHIVMLMVRCYCAHGCHIENHGLCYTSLEFGYAWLCFPHALVMW